MAVKYFNKKETVENQKSVDYFFIIKYILSKPYLLYHLILEIPFKMNWAVKVILYPLIIISFINSNAITGSVFATQGIIAMVVLFFAGKFVDKRSYMTGMNAAFLILAIASFMMALSVNLSMFWVFAGLFAVGEAISGPAKGVLEIKNVENEYRPEVIALFSTFGYIVEAFSPFFAGIILVWLNPQMVLLIYSLIIWFFLAFATLILKNRLKKLPI